jgi:plastocyanin
MIRNRYATARRHAGGLILRLSFALAPRVARAAVGALAALAAVAAVAEADAHVRPAPAGARHHAKPTSHAPSATGSARPATPRPGAPKPAPSAVGTPTPATSAVVGNPAASRVAALSVRARRSVAAHHRRVHRAVVRVHMAGDPPVSIVDFSFSPGTTTVHVGDTITWTNNGKQPHSAKADDHSFDTGILRHGQSAAHTFSTAGTFTYFCIVHPYMHGTVIVLAATTTTTTPTTTTPTTTTPSTTTPSTTTPAPSTTQAGQLPLTGADEVAAFAVGLLLLGAGIGLRARMRTRGEDEV